MALDVELVVDRGPGVEKLLRLTGDGDPRRWHTRCPVGWWETSARLFKRPPISRRLLRPSSPSAAPYDRGLSVTIASRTEPCRFGRSLISLRDACRSCLDCVRTSSTSSPSSTARPRQWILPSIRMKTSSRRHRPDAPGRRRRTRLAYQGPNFCVQRRTVSYETYMPRPASRFLTSHKLSAKRSYSKTER